MALQLWVKQAGKTQVEAARQFGITQPRMSDLMRGKIDLFSLDALMDMATAAGLEPHVSIKKPRASSRRPATQELAHRASPQSSTGG